jgi:hypothetical protein
LERALRERKRCCALKRHAIIRIIIELIIGFKLLVTFLAIDTRYR